MNSIVVIQARTSSSRLPAKTLLPLAGIPIVVLSAKRASNTGRNVIVVTSDDSSDDYLANLIRFNGIPCYRGSLNNVLERFVNALSNYKDETYVFRLTADNVFPDGALLDEIEKDFVYRDLEYLSCNGIPSGLPYGTSAEITRLKNLRLALNSNPSQYDIEHVTPFIQRKFGISYFDRYEQKQMGNFRCTIDCFDDYIEMQKLFEDVQDPIHESSFRLIDKLKHRNFQPIDVHQISPSKLILGTAQLGMNYGIANRNGQPDEKSASFLLKSAISNGIEYIDTARAYGKSEHVIGKVLSSGWENRVNIISKLSPLSNLDSTADINTCNAFVDSSLYQSLYSLRSSHIDTILLHREAHLQVCNGQVLKRLFYHRNEGRLKKIGVSVQSPEELLRSLEIKEIEHIQLPFNILDWRWNEISDYIIREKQLRKLIIHTRSTYLQGLLLDGRLSSWNFANAENATVVQKWLVDCSKNFKRDSVKDLCLAFVNSFDWIDGIVIGVETLDQLHENLAMLAKPSLEKAQVNSIIKNRPRLDISTLNPSLWKIC